MKLGICVVGIVACIGSNVSAQTWDEVTRSGTDKLSVNAASYKVITPTIRSAWFRFDRLTPNSAIAYSLALDRVDCDAEAVATVSVINYRADGSSVNSVTRDVLSLEYKPAAPETLAARIVTLLCTASKANR